MPGSGGGGEGGTLFVVATPLGHLGDLSARAASLLRTVPVVAAEDTRRTGALLSHLEAHPRLLSYHAHSRQGATDAVLRALAQGQDVALVSDAGSPAVSDPGAALVAAVRSAGHEVVPVPGPSAVTAALSAAGLPADRYLFLGFLPRKGAERTRLLERIGKEEVTIVLFEAPGRVRELVGDLSTACGPDRRAVVARELTKLHEEFRAGTLAELWEALPADQPPRGEHTIVLAGRERRGPSERDARREQARAVARRMVAAGVPRREVGTLLGELFGLGRNEAYRIVHGESER